MTDKEAINLIGERAKELVKKTDVQQEMLRIVGEKGKEDAEKWLYMLAIASLMGI